MAIANVHKAIYGILQDAGYPVSNGIRVAGSATPCLVFDLTSAECSVGMKGIHDLNVWTVGLQVVAVANTLDDVCAMIDGVMDQFNNGAWDNDTAQNIKLGITQFTVAFSTESIDDGQHDAERIGTMAISILAQEY